MKAEDLMVGDFVRYTEFDKDEIDRIEIIEPTRVWLEGGKTYIPLCYIEPIHLTPEILEKNGFIGEGYQILTLDDGHWLEYYNHEHRLTRFWEGIDEWQNHSKVRDVVFRCHCHYVHELQHALRLCGIEKEIEL